MALERRGCDVGQDAGADDGGADQQTVGDAQAAQRRVAPGRGQSP
jgi:hypothetical protein